MGAVSKWRYRKNLAATPPALVLTPRVGSPPGEAANKKAL
jgi:hypothetical protein